MLTTESRLPARDGAARHAASHLSAAQRRQLEGELQAERTRLERRLQRAREAVVLADAAAVGGDAAQDDPAQDAAAQDDAAERLEAIATALGRLHDGSYGACAGCRAPIPFGRLLVMPEAQHCLGCRARP